MKTIHKLHLPDPEARLLIRAAIRGLKGTKQVRQEREAAESLRKKLDVLANEIMAESAKTETAAEAENDQDRPNTAPQRRGRGSAEAGR